MKPKPGKPMQGLALSVIATVLFQSIAFAQASSPAVVENRKPTKAPSLAGLLFSICSAIASRNSRFASREPEHRSVEAKCAPRIRTRPNTQRSNQ